MRLVAVVVLAVALLGCASAVKVPAKAVHEVTPPIVKPVVVTSAKLAGNTVVEAAKLPIHVVKDTAKQSKKDNKDKK